MYMYVFRPREEATEAANLKRENITPTSVSEAQIAIRLRERSGWNPKWNKKRRKRIIKGH